MNRPDSSINSTRPFALTNRSAGGLGRPAAAANNSNTNRIQGFQVIPTMTTTMVGNRGASNSMQPFANTNRNAAVSGSAAAASNNDTSQSLGSRGIPTTMTTLGNRGASNSSSGIGSNNYNNNPNGENPPTIAAKLQGMAAQMRQKREEAHRALKLANERLRLAKEEEKVVAEAVRQAKEHLHTKLRVQLQKEAPQALAQAKKTLDATIKEYKFQHAELLYKQGQEKEQKAAMEKRCAQRAQVLTNLRRLIQAKQMQRQQAMVASVAMTMTPNATQNKDVLAIHAPLVKKMVAVTSGGIGLGTRRSRFPNSALVDEWTESTANMTESYVKAHAHRWSQWIRAETKDLQGATRATFAAVENLQLVVDGYHEAFGFGGGGGSNMDDTSQPPSPRHAVGGSTMDDTSRPPSPHNGRDSRMVETPPASPSLQGPAAGATAFVANSTVAATSAAGNSSTTTDRASEAADSLLLLNNNNHPRRLTMSPVATAPDEAARFDRGL